MKQCDFCKKVVMPDDSSSSICMSCWIKQHECDECGTIHPLGDDVNVSDDREVIYLCPNCCEKRHVRSCDNCGDMFVYDSMDHCGIVHKGDILCAFCAEHSFSCLSYCPICNRDVYYYQDHAILHGKYHHLDCIIKHSEILFRKF